MCLVLIGTLRIFFHTTVFFFKSIYLFIYLFIYLLFVCLFVYHLWRDHESGGWKWDCIKEWFSFAHYVLALCRIVDILLETLQVFFLFLHFPYQSDCLLLLLFSFQILERKGKCIINVNKKMTFEWPVVICHITPCQIIYRVYIKQKSSSSSFCYFDDNNNNNNNNNSDKAHIHSKRALKTRNITY